MGALSIRHTELSRSTFGNCFENTEHRLMASSMCRAAGANEAQVTTVSGGGQLEISDFAIHHKVDI